MSTDPTVCEAYALFLTEVPEMLQTLEQDLLSLKADYSLNRVHSLMRTTHTLKGAAASVGLETIKQVAHYLEEVFKSFYNPNVVIDSEIEDLLFQAYECLRLPISTANLSTAQTPAINTVDDTQATEGYSGENLCLERLSTGLADSQQNILDSEVLNRVTSIFTQLQEKLGENYCTVTQLPTSADLGIDIIQSIFETDVKERLAALASALAQPKVQQVEVLLRAMAEVFVGLAESLQLPGFGAIAQDVLTALDADPNQAVTIAQIAIEDFQRSVNLVLAGDRTLGGEPSAVLQQLAREKRTLDSARGAGGVFTDGSVRVDLGRLERLNYLTGDLLTKQTQQGATTEQLQEIVQTLQEQVLRHQQTLSRIHDWSNRQLSTPDSEAPLDREFNVMLKSAWEETVRLAAQTRDVALLNQECSQTLEQQQQLLGDVRDDLTGARLSSLGDIFNRLHRVLQQLAAVYGKPAELQISGTQLMVDKTIVQKLYDPLLHLIRNAFDHGIEIPNIRRQLGKPETGQIRIHAYQPMRWTVIEVSDDGKGLDFEKILERGIEMNMLSWEQAFNLSEERLLELLFAPGFSTAAQVNDLSGRGLGLDVVRSQLQLLQGSITVQSEPQQGTTFTLKIPHTPTMLKLGESTAATIIPTTHQTTEQSVINAADDLRQRPKDSGTQVNDMELHYMVIDPAHLPVVKERKLRTSAFFTWQTGSVVFVLPYNSIEEFLIAEADQIIQVQEQMFLHWREQMIPLYQLSEMMNYNSPLLDAQSEDEAMLQTSPNDSELWQKNVLVLNHFQRVFAIESVMTSLVTQPELILKPFGQAIAPPSYTVGCTILEDNQLVVVIDTIALLKKYL